MRLEDVRAFELFHEGDHADYWWVLVEGVVELVRRVGREDIVVGRMDMPGRWAGGFRAWDEDGVYLATGRGATPGRVLRLGAISLEQLNAVLEPLGQAITDPDSPAAPEDAPA